MFIKPPPPRFEISDLAMNDSDPRYSNAIKCVQMYWRRATHMKEKHCARYLEFLRPEHVADFIPAESSSTTASSHILYTGSRDSKGKIKIQNAYWPDYLLLSALYEHIPEDYAAAIRKRYVDSTLQKDYTADYRRIHPEPAPDIQKGPGMFPLVKDNEAPTLNTSSQQEDTTLIGSSSTPEASPLARSAAQDTWNIDNVVSILSLSSSKKRPNSSPESIVKRVKVDSYEVLEKIHQEAERIQQAITANQDTKLRDMREAIEENKQALNTMQGELRQFMSAVATTLRDIQERLDDLGQVGGLF